MTKLSLSSLTGVLLLQVLLSGCFTGVDSTPRITDSQVKRSVAAPSADDLYLSDITAPRLSQWQPGKRFLVTDPKISLVMNNRTMENAPSAGSHLSFVRATPQKGVTGLETTILEFSDSISRKFTYTISQPLDTLLKRTVRVPFTIDLDIVSALKNKLVGNSYYILTPLWLDENGETKRQRKFIPVTVSDLIPGNSAHTAVVIFSDSIGTHGAVYLNPGTAVSRSFPSQFSLTDPKLRHPAISPRVWENIIGSKVSQGMTRDECRISLGPPEEVTTYPGYSFLHEAWRYPDGKYLIFEDGILTGVQNR